MRYVIIIVTIACFIIWDGLYNGGRYIDASVTSVKNVVRMVTG
ncbi:hypothetical protein [Aquamicrobium terrae]|uniref:Lysis protein n=1 Tax=Aquamicrobium terrae TaxID=1324945 RepID=A0ABV2N0I2_9HYPH